MDGSLQWRSILVGGMITCTIHQMVFSVMSIEFLSRQVCGQPKELLNMIESSAQDKSEVLFNWYCGPNAVHRFADRCYRTYGTEQRDLGRMVLARGGRFELSVMVTGKLSQSELRYVFLTSRSWA